MSNSLSLTFPYLAVFRKPYGHAVCGQLLFSVRTPQPARDEADGGALHRVPQRQHAPDCQSWPEGTSQALSAPASPGNPAFLPSHAFIPEGSARNVDLLVLVGLWRGGLEWYCHAWRDSHGLRGPEEQREEGEGVLPKRGGRLISSC